MTGTDANEAVRWLDPAELSAWKGLQRMHAHLNGVLARQLSAGGELSLQDYGVLAVLSDRADGRMRAFELGRELGWEKSRLSHHVARMVERGLVVRERCPSDQRGLFVAITAGGHRALSQAAPGHVAAVRRSFVDLLTPAQLGVLAEIAETVVDALGPRCLAEAGDHGGQEPDPVTG